MKLPVISLAILGGQIFAAHQLGGTFADQLERFQSYYTGFDFKGQFLPHNLAIGYGPWLAKRFILPIARPRIAGVHLPVSLS